MSEGLYGISREAQMPALLEMLRIPYLGSDPLTLSLCLEKSRTKEILSYHGLRTAQFTVINSMEAIRGSEVSFPAIVKPLHEGSSKGIYNSSVVRSTEELLEAVQLTMVRHGEPALVEDYLPGREFTVAVLGNGDKVRLLPIIELKFDVLPIGANSIYSYEAKWIWDTVDNPLDIYECPAKLDSSLKAEIEILTKDAYRVMNCRDWSRIDIRLDAKGRPNILEINPLPGILPRKEDNSCFPKAARMAGMSYNELINTVLDIALERCGIYATTNRQRAVEVV
jgi:D-alanine-D-alanine ligase